MIDRAKLSDQLIIHEGLTPEDKLKAYKRGWYLRNKDRQNELCRLWYHANKERHRAIQKRYEQVVKELVRVDPIRHAKELVGQIRGRAKRAGLPFNIDYTDIPIPEFCPVLGLKLARNKGKVSANSATVDRIVPSKGYVRGNVIVVSYRANLIKSNATADEILAVGLFYKRLADD